MSTKVQYLEKKRNRYWFVRAIPKAHRNNPFFANHGTNYTKNLQTDSLSLAIQRRDHIIALWDKATSSNPRDVYAITRQAVSELDYSYTSDGAMDDYSLHVHGLVDGWERKYPRNETGHPIGMTEAEMAELKAVQNARKEAATGKAQSNPYPMSLQEACEHTVETKRSSGTKQSGLDKFSRAVRYLEASEGGSLAVAEIARATVKRFIKEKRVEGISDKTVKGYLTCLSQVWEEARDLGEVSEDVSNPFLGHGLKDDSIPWEMLQGFQVKQILANELSREDRLMYLMGYYTGARAEELLKLTARSIVPREGDNGALIKCIHLAEKTKENRRGGKTENATRFIPIHSALEAELEGFVGFETSYNQFNKRRRKLFIELFGEDSKGHLVFHSLRHAFLTQLVNKTGSEMIAKQLIGHSRSGSGVTGRYFHGSGLQQLKEAVEAIPEV